MKPEDLATLSFVFLADELSALSRIRIMPGLRAGRVRLRRLIGYLGWIALLVGGLFGALHQDLLPRGFSSDIMLLTVVLSLLGYIAGFIACQWADRASTESIFNMLAQQQTTTEVTLTAHGIEVQTALAKQIIFRGVITTVDTTPILWLGWSGQNVSLAIPRRAFVTVAAEEKFTSEVLRRAAI
jgi:hypothetical protein